MTTAAAQSSTPRPDGRGLDQNPYVGLRPYSETERSLFFGRDRDRRVFVDMVLANRLTLLFAASGVGKSSLLQAAVLPQIKDPGQENLDAVYCNNWAGDPLKSIRQAAISSLVASGRVSAGSLAHNLHSDSLLQFFELLAQLVRPPLVIVLDQFEEFFRYHRTSPAFPEYRRQLVELIVDRQVPISLVLSMREDFALSLNAFKPEIPTVLFNNFYRLEKLPREEARDAILQPATQAGYHYEPELLSQLLSDLASREKSLSTPLAERAEYIEPPYLQIICAQLFELDRADPQKTLRLATYRQLGGAKGLLSRYVGHVTADLSSLQERQIASRCFSFLITRHGTKVAHTVDSLARELREPASRIASVLEKLEAARLLRRQSQEETTWYELYHDLFSDSVDEWNENFKSKQRIRKAFITSTSVLLILASLYAIYDLSINLKNHHLRLSIKAGQRGQVEIYRGKVDSYDIFRRQRYYAETGITRKEIEPDQLFTQRGVIDLQQFDDEWAERLHGADRMQFLRNRGDLADVLRFAGDRLKATASDRTWEALNELSRLRINRRYDLIRDSLTSPNRQAILDSFFNVFRARRSESWGNNERRTLRTGSRSLLEQDDWRFSELLRHILRLPRGSKVGDAAGALTLLEGDGAIADLVAALASAPDSAQDTIKDALLDLDPNRVAAEIERRLRPERAAPVSAAQGKATDKPTTRWLEVLARLRGRAGRAAIKRLIAEGDTAIKQEAISAMAQQVDNRDLVEPFLAHSQVELAVAAAKALSYPASDVALGQIRALRDRWDDKARETKIEEILSRVSPHSAGAERRFAKSLARTISRLDTSLGCRENDILWDALDASPKVLEEVIKNVESSSRRFLMTCVSRQVLLRHLPDLQAMSLSPAQSSGVVGEIFRRLYAEVPDEALRLLQRMIDGGERQRHSVAIAIVRDLRSERGYALLARLIFNPAAASETQLSALSAFGSGSTFDIAPGPYRPTIAQALRRAGASPEDADVRQRAAAALGEWLGEGALPDLGRLLQDKDKEVRDAAAAALTALRSPAAVALLSPKGGPAEPSGGPDDDLEPDLPDRLLTQRAIKERQLLYRLRNRHGSSRGEWRTEISRRISRLAQISSCEPAAWLKAAAETGDEAVQKNVAEAVWELGLASCRPVIESELRRLSEEPHAMMLGSLALLSRKSDLPRIEQEYSKLQYPFNDGNVDMVLSEISVQRHHDLLESQGRSISWWLGSMQTWPARLLLNYAVSERDWVWRLVNMPELSARSKEVVASRRMLARLLRRLDDTEKSSLAKWVKYSKNLHPEHGNQVATIALRMGELQTSYRERDGVIDSSLRMLVQGQQSDAVPGLLQQSSWGGLSLSGGNRRALAWLNPQRFAPNTPQWWPILAAQCDPEYRAKFSTLSYLTTSQRSSVAQLLAMREEPCSAEILLALSQDVASGVRAAAAEALGSLEKNPQEAALLRLLDDPSLHVQRAAGIALSKLATATSVPTLAARVDSKRETPLYVVVPMLYALGHAGTANAAKALLEAATQYEGTVARHAYRALGDMHATGAVADLLTHLAGYQARMQKWRSNRDRKETDPVRKSDSRVDAAGSAGDSPQPDGYALAELAMTLGRLAPPNTAFDLLHHDLADVRMATAMGLALQMKPGLIEQLDALRAQSNDPLFRHAAYRAIDMSLDLLELLANESEIRSLEELSRGGRIRDQEGVLARIDWTLDLLLPSRRSPIADAKGAQL